jgi:ribosomal RNA-processing protein 36
VSSSLEDDEEAILEEMSQIPFDVLLKTKEGSGVSRPKHTVRRQLKRERRESSHEQHQSSSQAKEEGTERKKKGKHMPKEISSKRTYNPFRDEEASRKRKKRDPRFDKVEDADQSQSDKVNARARKNYSFVFDELIPQEELKLKSTLKKVKGQGKKERLQKKLKRLQSQVTQHKAEKRKTETKKQILKTSAMRSAKTGKKFFLKKSEIKQQMLLDKYNELKKQGKLEDFLAKKRRRNASKEHKRIPFERNQRQDR